MSNNPITELYVLGDDGETYEGINPSTIAEAVEDEANESNVQNFINNGISNWNQIQTGKEYVTSNLVYESFNTLNNKYNELNGNAVRYILEWDATNQNNFSSIELPVKKGFTYKVIGSETTIGNRTFKPNDFIVINRDIEKTDVINNNDVDILLGYGNGGGGIITDRVVSDVFETKTSLDEYQGGRSDCIVIVANDEKHQGLLSYYEYISEEIQYDREVNTYNDLLNIKTLVITPEFNYYEIVDSSNSSIHYVTLSKYIDTLVNVPVPQLYYIDVGYIVKVVSDETNNNLTTYYKWDGIKWIYVTDSDSNWKYLFSYFDYSKSEINTMISNLNYQINNINNSLNNIWNQINDLDRRVTELESR